MSTYDMKDFYSSIVLPIKFLQFNRVIFRFNEDTLLEIMGMDLPDIRSSIQSIGTNVFAVDLGNEQGFFFGCGQTLLNVEDVFGNDVRSDETFLNGHSTGFISDDGAQFAFDWTPIATDECHARTLRNKQYSSIHEALLDIDTTVSTLLVEKIVSYLCCGRPDLDGRTIRAIL